MKDKFYIIWDSAVKISSSSKCQEMFLREGSEMWMWGLCCTMKRKMEVILNRRNRMCEGSDWWADIKPKKRKKFTVNETGKASKEQVTGDLVSQVRVWIYFPWPQGA